MNIEDDRHPDRKKGSLSRIETTSGWQAFKRHTVQIEDKELRVRIEQVAESTSQLLDPFAADIVYHHSCWMKYVTNPLHRPYLTTHCENVTYFEMKNLFLRYIDQIIFTDHEIRTTQSLLLEYKRLANEYGFPCGDVRSSFIKDMLIREYSELIGFRERKEKNKSELVFDQGGGSNYVDMVVSSLGISHEQLVENVSQRLGSSIIGDTQESPWPPFIEELESDELFSDYLVLLMQKLYTKGHPRSAKLDKSNPMLKTLVSLITYFVTGKKTNMAINIAVDVHGSTRSRELVDMLHGNGLCISYEDLLLLYDHWALRDVQLSTTCPADIREGEPAIQIMDNDDFPFDSLTGSATRAHRTNVMFVQPAVEKQIGFDTNTTSRCKNKKIIKEKLKEVCEDLTAVDQYIIPAGASSEPPARNKIDAKDDGTRPQRIRSVLHSLAHASSSGLRPQPEEEKVPSYSGLQS